MYQEPERMSRKSAYSPLLGNRNCTPKHSPGTRRAQRTPACLHCGTGRDDVINQQKCPALHPVGGSGRYAECSAYVLRTQRNTKRSLRWCITNPRKDTVKAGGSRHRLYPSSYKQALIEASFPEFGNVQGNRDPSIDSLIRSRQKNPPDLPPELDPEDSASPVLQFMNEHLKGSVLFKEPGNHEAGNRI